MIEERVIKSRERLEHLPKYITSSPESSAQYDRAHTVTVSVIGVTMYFDDRTQWIYYPDGTSKQLK